MNHASTNAVQAEFWNSDAGKKWAADQQEMDTLLTPVLDKVLSAANVAEGQSVLDIGCGTGASILALCDIVGPEGFVQGCDISDVMLSRAKERVAEAGHSNVTLTLADAQTHAFEPGRFDHVVSRFGVMFFEDPAAAFANMAKGLRPGGRMTFIAWAPMAVNPWFKVPRDAAVARVGPPAVRPDPNAPGPMGFQDGERVVGLLRDAGLVNASYEVVEVPMHPDGDLNRVAEMAAGLGPALRVMQEHSATEEDLAAVIAQITEDFRPFETDQGMRMPTRLNLFTAAVP